jgi:hypothetical protein
VLGLLCLVRTTVCCCFPCVCTVAVLFQAVDLLWFPVVANVAPVCWCGLCDCQDAMAIYSLTEEDKEKIAELARDPNIADRVSIPFVRRDLNRLRAQGWLPPC